MQALDLTIPSHQSELDLPQADDIKINDTGPVMRAARQRDRTGADDLCLPSSTARWCTGLQLSVRGLGTSPKAIAVSSQPLAGAGREPTFLGHSIGRWVDVDDDGRYDALEIETRGLKGPRTYEGSGMPFHEDNQTVVKERLFLDRANPDALSDEITVIGHEQDRTERVGPAKRRWPLGGCRRFQRRSAVLRDGHTLVFTRMSISMPTDILSIFGDAALHD